MSRLTWLGANDSFQKLWTFQKPMKVSRPSNYVLSEINPRVKDKHCFRYIRKTKCEIPNVVTANKKPMKV